MFVIILSVIVCAGPYEKWSAMITRKHNWFAIVVALACATMAFRSRGKQQTQDELEVFIGMLFILAVVVTSSLKGRYVTACNQDEFDKSNAQG